MMNEHANTIHRDYIHYLVILWEEEQSYKIFVLDSIFHFKNINKLYNPFNNLITNAKIIKSIINHISQIKLCRVT